MHFGDHRHKEGIDPAVEVLQLRERLAGLLGSEEYQLAVEIKEDVATVVGDRDTALTEVRDEVDAAIAAARKRELGRACKGLIAEKVAAALETERGPILEQAQAEAAAAAEEAVRHFRQEEAPAYRAEVRQRLARPAVAAAILGEKKAIVKEETAAAGVDASPMAPIHEETQQELKTRAAEIRKRTHGTHVLRYDMLRPDDTITLCFTRKGQGNEPYTTGSGDYGWSSTYNSSQERRKLTLKLLDPEHGSFEVVDDSWSHPPYPSENGIWAEREILVLGEVPQRKKGPEPLLVKARPVLIQALDGEDVAASDDELWWVGLGKDEYRILS